MGCTDSNDTSYILQSYCKKEIVSPASLAQQPITTTDSVEDTVYCLDTGQAVTVYDWCGGEGGATVLWKDVQSELSR